MTGVDAPHCALQLRRRRLHERSPEPRRLAFVDVALVRPGDQIGRFDTDGEFFRVTIDEAEFRCWARP